MGVGDVILITNNQESQNQLTQKLSPPASKLNIIEFDKESIIKESPSKSLHVSKRQEQIKQNLDQMKANQGQKIKIKLTPKTQTSSQIQVAI